MKIAALGLGNVLQGDDGLGPTVVRRLLAAFEFRPEIRIEDLGTPGLHLHPLLADLDAVVLVDTVLGDGEPGTISIYRREELLGAPAGVRTSPHDPGLVETLEALDFAGTAPKEVSVVGVVPGDTGAGVALSPKVERSLPDVEAAVLAELDRLGVRASPREPARPPDLWWRRDAGNRR